MRQLQGIILDLAPDGIMCPVGIVTSVVGTMWWTTWAVVRSKGYLDGSNCNQKSCLKQSCHLKLYTMYSYRWSL